MVGNASRAVMALWWLILLFSVTFCGSPAKSNRTVIAATNANPIPSPVPIDINPVPSPSPSPIVQAVTTAPYLANRILTNEAPAALLNGTGLGAMLVYPAAVPGADVIYECRANAAGPSIRLSKFQAACAELGLQAFPALYLKQVNDNGPLHLVRSCFNPKRKIFFVKLGNNLCNALPGLDPAFTASFADSSEAEILGYAATAGYSL